MRFSILFFSFVLFFNIGCENDLEQVNQFFPEEVTNQEITKDITMFYSDSAIVRVKLIAPSMIRHLQTTNPYQEYPEGMYVEFYDDYGKKQGQITSRHGLRYEHKNQVILQDSVVWLSAQGEKLESDEMIWDDQKHIVFSDKWSKITQPGKDIVYTYGFEANEDFTHWKLKTMEGNLKYNPEIGKKSSKPE